MNNIPRSPNFKILVVASILFQVSMLGGTGQVLALRSTKIERFPIKMTLKSYCNKELGICFKYPQNFKIYQQNEYTLVVKSDYKNQEHPGVSIHMTIKRISLKHESIEDVKRRIEETNRMIKIANKMKRKAESNIFSCKLEISSIEKINNYELVKIKKGNDFFYCLLSTKGTFYLDDTTDLPTSKKILKQEGLYNYYRSIFCKILQSITIIDQGGVR